MGLRRAWAALEAARGEEHPFGWERFYRGVVYHGTGSCVWLGDGPALVIRRGEHVPVVEMQDDETLEMVAMPVDEIRFWELMERAELREVG